MISVLVPTYSRPELLPRALESLVNQSHTDWECIVIQNGPRCHNEYAEIALYYLTDLRFTFAFRPKASLPAALNDAWKLSRGDFMAVLEDDDEWAPSFLSDMHDFLVNHPSLDLVYADQVEIYQGEVVNWVNPPESYSRQKLLNGNWIAMPMVMFRRSALEHIGGFDEECGGGTDWDTWLRMSARSGVGHLKKTLVVHNWQPNGDNYSLNKQMMASVVPWIVQKRRAGAYGKV